MARVVIADVRFISWFEIQLYPLTRPESGVKCSERGLTLEGWLHTARGVIFLSSPTPCNSKVVKLGVAITSSRTGGMSRLEPFLPKCTCLMCFQFITAF